MSDESLEVDIEFESNDHVTPKVHKMHGAVEKLGHSVQHINQHLLSMGTNMLGMSALMGLHSSVEGAERYIEHLKTIQDLTGLAADRAGGISNAFVETGVEMEDVEGIMAKMVKRGTVLNEGQKMAAGLARKYGISLKEGPEKSFISMSKAVTEKGLGAGEIARSMGVTVKAAGKMVDLLKKGPEEVKRLFEEGRAENEGFNEKAMEGMQEYHEATNRIGLAWKRLTAGILIKLAPGMAKLADKFSASVGGWTEKAVKFGDYLVNHMTQIIAMARTYAKIMLVSSIAQRLTGKGILGNLGRAGSFVRGAAGGAHGGGGAIGGIAGALPTITAFFSGISKMSPIIGGLMRLTGVLGIIVAVGGAISAMVGDSSALRASLGKAISGIAKLFAEDAPLGIAIRGLADLFLQAVGKIAEGIGLIAESADALAHGESLNANRQRKRFERVDKINAGADAALIAQRYMDAVAKTGRKATKAELLWYEEAQNALKRSAQVGSSGYSDFAQKRLDKLKGKFGAADKVPEKADVYQDFRGSRFDITQAFAEGFDPDRIAVAFANDLSSMGERKLQSSFAPLYTVR